MAGTSWRKATLKALDAQPGETVLDLAAGTGTSAEPMADAGVRVVACDLSVGGFIKDVGRYLLKGERAAEMVALRTKRLSVKSFMDAWTLNVERLQQWMSGVLQWHQTVDRYKEFELRSARTHERVFGAPSGLGTSAARIASPSSGRKYQPQAPDSSAGRNADSSSR